MIIGIGTDIIEVERVLKSIESEGFKNKVYTPAEITYCEAKLNKAENYAARFAAKEAFAKALGTGFRGQINFTEIEVLNDDLGKPYIQTTGDTQNYLIQRRAGKIHLSLSHTKSTAIAMVVIEEALT
jgi:holo-[acyl-carrier protein] synthase